jgi:hypothetical protein
MKKVLARFHWDCGRQGDVNGLFVTTEGQIKSAIGSQVYFGEILGKHSEVSGEFEEKDITVVSEDQEFISKLVEVIGSSHISGYNPFDYIEDDEDETEDEDEE